MRLVIAEDSGLIRESLAALLVSAGHEVAGLASTGPQAVALTSECRPDLVVMDVRMPEHDEGIRAANSIRARDPHQPILLLSQYGPPRGAAQLLRNPGTGYLLKDRVLDVEQFLDAARRVATGGTALDPAVVGALIESATGHRRLQVLTDAEMRVLGLMAQGHSNGAIAGTLTVSTRTVETHIGSIFAKLDITSTPETHRRVQAVLAYLKDTSQRSPLE